MPLSDLRLEDGYRTNETAILDGFYIPCLREACAYDRSVGYFSSGALSLSLAGISELVRKGGRIRLIASPNLSANDLAAIEDGYEARKVIDAATERCTSELVAKLPSEQLSLLRWLIAHELLDIRLAMLDGPTPALYHEKRGIFHDNACNIVSFMGSANETAAALRANFESVEVFRSWILPEKQRTERHASDFERLWRGDQKGIITTHFPEAARSVILASVDEDLEVNFKAFDSPATERKTLIERDLRDFQRDAIRSWIGNNCRGIFRMPTGSGKTITALAAARLMVNDYARRRQPFGIVIVAPFKDLVEQWDSESRNFEFGPILCYENRHNWEGRLRNVMTAVASGGRPSFACITTNATFASEGFQAALDSFRADTLLIADEVHNIGSSQSRTLLSEQFKLRLGLSATPERWYDDDGTDALMKYFGGVVYSMTMKEAIDCGALTPYRYFVHPIRLNDEETIQFIALSEKIRKISGFASADDETGMNDQLKMLLIKRAAVVANARGKGPLLERLVQDDLPQKHTLVYCGTGSAISDDGGDIRVADDISFRLNGMHLRSATYTAETPSYIRSILRADFARGRIQYLVAMRCLDEGVDIPATQRAYFLASSTNPRQFIQRRGRVLRRSEGKVRAEIHDMVTMLSPEIGGSEAYERDILCKELRRVKQFAEIAQNGDAALGALMSIIGNKSIFFES